jgi:uncharacterized protein involved in exopolysaccharide biosynthesis
MIPITASNPVPFRQRTPLAAAGSVFITVFLVVVIITTAITFILPESFASTARIKVEPEVPPIPPTAGEFHFDPYFIQTTFEIIQSPPILNPVIDKLNLNVAWGRKYFAGQTLKSSQTLEILKQRLQLAPMGNTGLVAITAYSDDRNETAQIANAVAESYRDFRVLSVGKTVGRVPKDSLVQITDRAQPGLVPVRPNKPLNICLGAVAGAFLGLVAGGIAALVASKRGNRG